MNSTMMFRAVSAGALLTGMALVPTLASAQAPAQLDGYCYVRKTDMQRNSSTDSYGVTRAYARCYNGIYYAYSGEAYSAPAAPDGYQVAYYTRRPGAEYYSRVVDANSRYQSSQSYSASSTSTYTGADRYATTSGYGATAYGDDYGRQDGYTVRSDAYDDSRDGDEHDYRSDDRDSRSDDRAYGSADNGYDRDYTSHSAVQGWRDDRGQWHVGRPRAVGWQDEAGRWHIGSIDVYGWRDARGQWHESRDDDNDDDDTAGNGGNYGAQSRYDND
jgi:hypothetical protein